MRQHGHVDYSSAEATTKPPQSKLLTLIDSRVKLTLQRLFPSSASLLLSPVKGPNLDESSNNKTLSSDFKLEPFPKPFDGYLVNEAGKSDEARLDSSCSHNLAPAPVLEPVTWTCSFCKQKSIPEHIINCQVAIH